jgi:uncharacterized protein YbjT (DUF2867 family)
MKIAVAGATGRVGRPLVDVLRGEGHDVVAMSRATGVNVITGEGLAGALAGVERVIDVTSGPSPDQKEATEFFVTATRNLQEAAKRAKAKWMIVISIIGIDRFQAGYMAAKVAHEKAVRAGPIPSRILRAAQFHEFVAEIVEWGKRGDVCYVPKMRTQLVAARSVAEALADLAINPGTRAAAVSGKAPTLDVAGPKVENLVDAAAQLIARRGDPLRVEGVSNPADPDRELYETDGLLPGPHAKLEGPTFGEWLTSQRTASVGTLVHP